MSIQKFDRVLRTGSLPALYLSAMVNATIRWLSGASLKVARKAFYHLETIKEQDRTDFCGSESLVLRVYTTTTDHYLVVGQSYFPFIYD